MSTFLNIDHVIVVLFAGLLCWAVFCDLTSLRIPNRLTIAISILFIAHGFAARSAVDWGGSLLVAAAVFAAATVLFHFRLMGGGDVKLMAAIALWAGPADVLGFLVVTSLAGGILALITLSWFRPFLEVAFDFLGASRTIQGVAQGVVPYGLAIATGGFVVAANRLWG